jgi:catechol 2,3-dioxygenase-like lactoylglutathione lyase family enzyme
MEATMMSIEENLEVVTLNVTDIDRAKGFYQSLGWRLLGHK